jgi:hypothetical protein
MRTFTVISSPNYSPKEKIIYNGFDESFDGDLIAVVTFDGEPAIYSIDNQQATKELYKYYKDLYNRLPERLIIYTRNK